MKLMAAFVGTVAVAVAERHDGRPGEGGEGGGMANAKVMTR